MLEPLQGNTLRLMSTRGGISKLSLIALLIFAGTIGALISYMFLIGYYVSMGFRVPEEPSIVIVSASFTPQNATMFTVSILNPSYSPSNATVNQVKVMAGNMVHSTEILQPSVREIKPAELKNFTCKWDWGNYTGEEVRILAFIAEGSGATFNTTTPVIGMAITGAHSDAAENTNSSNVTVPARTDSSQIILTFDDGHQYRSNDESVEIMAEFNYSGVAFVPVQVFDWQPASFWINLSESGWEIGGHSWTHANLTTCTPEELHHETVEANARLEELLGEEVTSFAYPHSRGSDDPEILAKLEEAGLIYGREHMFHSGWNGSPSLQINSYCIKEEIWQQRLSIAIEDAIEYGISVIMFHGVNEDLRGWGAVTPETFRECLQQISDAGLEVVTFRDLAEETPNDPVDLVSVMF